MSVASAESWNEIFAKHGYVFRIPNPKLKCLLEQQEFPSGSQFLDLGCGTGRHLLLALEHGLQAIGLDNSPEALRLADDLVRGHGFKADLVQRNMEGRLPFETGSMTCVAAVQSVHHNTKARIQSVFEEVTRLLRTGGWFFLSVPTQMNQGAMFREIEIGTFAPLDGPEKDVPHHFFTETELEEMLPHLQIRSREIDDTGHMCVVARRR